MQTKKAGFATSVIVKTIAFIGVIILLILGGISVIAGYMMWEENFYGRTKEEIHEEIIGDMANRDARYSLYLLLNESSDVADSFTNQDKINIIISKDNNVIYEANRKEGNEKEFTFTYYYWDIIDDYMKQLDGLGEGGEAYEANQEYQVTIYLDSMYESYNKYYFVSKLIDYGYALRYGVWGILGCSLIGAISVFVFLMYSAGRRKEEAEIVARGMAKIPLEIYLSLQGIIGFLMLSFIVWTLSYYDVNVLTIAATSVTTILGMVIVLLTCMNLAVRMKVGKWWRNTVSFWGMGMILRVSKKCLSLIKSMIHSIPLVWKSLILCVGISFFVIVGGTALYDEFSRMLFLFVCCSFICCYMLYIMLLLKQFKIASKALADGKLSYQVDTRRMPKEFQEAGENLNALAQGLTKAVEEKMKSERMKTELITNVSHDIKTPLTSIINYTDLIREEKTDNVKIQEYSETLFRQSNRLKKLIEDLVEASKASSGNMEILLEPCEIGVLLYQTVGEYKQKLEDANLEMIVKQPEEAVEIMADGRRLWRVLENLLNNTCKYAQGGTRVYLTLEKKHGKALISLKNISKYPLDISEDELMERFVRGDNSRHSEGNGLGLSIAQSLTELQGGRLSLIIDGDLFKVVLKFDCIAENET